CSRRAARKWRSSRCSSWARASSVGRPTSRPRWRRRPLPRPDGEESPRNGAAGLDATPAAASEKPHNRGRRPSASRRIAVDASGELVSPNDSPVASAVPIPAAAAQLRYHRVLLKLSGEALMGDDAYGINAETIQRMVREIAAVVSMGVELAIVIGGGNIFRGVAGGAAGMDR